MDNQSFDIIKIYEDKIETIEKNIRHLEAELEEVSKQNSSTRMMMMILIFSVIFFLIYMNNMLK